MLTVRPSSHASLLLTLLLIAATLLFLLLLHADPAKAAVGHSGFAGDGRHTAFLLEGASVSVALVAYYSLRSVRPVQRDEDARDT